MIYRCILPDWAKTEFPDRRKVLEGEFTTEKILDLNSQFYNIYFLPNHPSSYDPKVVVDGSHIDVFNYVFADMDLKEGKHASKEEFVDLILNFGLDPSFIVDSGNGIHVYWRVTDLDPISFLRLQRRVIRQFNTDEAVAKVYQLMRVPNTLNTKTKGQPKRCDIIYDSPKEYSCEDLDKKLVSITLEDEEYCQAHFNKTYNIHDENLKVDEAMPVKFAHLLRQNQEVKDIWSGNTDDRSRSDFRLAHIMFANGFSKEEATSVLVNSAKAISRAPKHRISYAVNIVSQIWTFELGGTELTLSKTVKEILEKQGDMLKGTRFPCHRYLDATHHGFRLGQVIGLVAGSGVGKTAMALNMFMGFVKNNPDFDHFFVPLEQPANEIADRWKTMCGDQEQLHNKVHVISNYEDDGSFRHLSLSEIRDYIIKFQEKNGRKVGCVVIDHIGALKKKSKDGENQGIMDICHEMKAFAIQTNTMLVMQSQSSREKAGIGDLELSKDAAYGTVYFESYCDYLITIWQPLKRCYSEDGCPTVTAFKFCKIRHKKTGMDEIQEDTPYRLYFDPKIEHLRELTQDEEKSFEFFNNKAVNLRKRDRKTDILTYSSISWTKGDLDGKANSNKDSDAA